jgi:hypothetical protein
MMSAPPQTSTGVILPKPKGARDRPPKKHPALREHMTSQLISQHG